MGLRFRLALRAAVGSRARLAGLLLALVSLLAFSFFASFLGFSLVGLLERSEPRFALPALSALATAFGLSWALAPLLAGIAATETHDLDRLLHYPLPLPLLVGSSLVANAVQPMVLAQLPPAAAVGLALAGPGARWPAATAGLLLALAFALAAGQLVGLALHAASRQRRWADRALVVGIGLSMALSLLPILFLSGGGGWLRRWLVALLERDLFALSPFAWGVRAAVHAGRGEPLAFGVWAGASLLATAAAVGGSALLARAFYRGELNLGEARSGRGRPARMPLPGALGALVEKDLRVSWRDPRLKTLVFSSLIGPMVVLFALSQGMRRLGPGVLVMLASFMGLGALGANVLALERNGLGLLFSFPIPRARLLVAKNLVTTLLRAPGLLLIAVATLFIVGPVQVPAIAAIVLVTQLMACAVDNYLSVLLPLPVAAAGRDPNAPASGGRGLLAALGGLLAMLASLLLAAPFAFLAWLPELLGLRWLWAGSLPLAIAGALAVYAMLVAGAARLLERREPELLAAARGD